jgi:hypothetical protein
MNTLQLKEIFSSRHLLCTCFGHKLYVKREVTPNFKEFKCSICQLELTNDEQGAKIELTPHLKEVNETLLQFYFKKHSHSLIAS